MSSDPKTQCYRELELLKHEYEERARPILKRLVDIISHEPPPPMIITRSEAKALGIDLDE